MPAAVPVGFAGVTPATPAAPLLGTSLNRLVVEKLPSGQGFDLAVRDGNTGFTFFNIDGHQYDYDPAAQSLAITNGRLLISKEFANALGRPSDAGHCGKISIGAAMQPIQDHSACQRRNQIDGDAALQHASVPEPRTLCPARMSSLGTSKTWTGREHRDTGRPGYRNRLL